MASELWQRLRAARRYADLRQEDIRLVCGVSRSAIAQWEADDESKRTKPDLNQIKAHAKRCGLPIEWYLNDNANVDDVWQVGKLTAPTAPPAPMPVADDLLLGAVKFFVSQQRPELLAGFGRKIPLVSQDFTPDFWWGKTVVVISAKGLDRDAGCLLMAERSAGDKQRKVLVSFTPVAPAEKDALAKVFGIELVAATSPEDVAQLLVSLA